jgi:hypothetical protein
MSILLYTIGCKVELSKYFCYNSPEADRYYFRHRRLHVLSDINFLIFFVSMTVGVKYFKRPNQHNKGKNRNNTVGHL